MTPYSRQDLPLFLACGCWVIKILGPPDLDGKREYTLFDKRERVTTEEQVTQHMHQHNQTKGRASCLT